MTGKVHRADRARRGREEDKEGDGVDVHLREKETREGNGEGDYPALLTNSLLALATRTPFPYKNHAGRYADFHSCRHLFITSLERAGIRPKMAQTLARHSDVRLTLGLYTHVDLPDQTAAIAALLAPPGV